MNLYINGKKPDKNQTDNNKEENKISKEKEFEIENQLDIKEDNYDDISFKDNNSQYSSKKRNRNDSINSFPFLEEIEEFNLFKNKPLEKPKKNLKLKTIQHRTHKTKIKSKLNFLKKLLKKAQFPFYLFSFQIFSFFL